MVPLLRQKGEEAKPCESQQSGRSRPKWRCPNGGAQMEVPKWRCPNGGSQMEVPKWRCPNGGAQMEVAKRRCPDEPPA
ncbi:hypothetical protein PVC01_050027700 [Plasmodium vivax]|uniref:Uncharacterized protein n=1 Tax=Plasmodium vivax TaxID=5855 RepID=A0A1G4H940_PLAVI|nr:hypothetical protein PVC01_050027700 [Plasmodium vivax]